MKIKILLCDPDKPRTHYEDHGGFMHTSAYPGLGLKVFKEVKTRHQDDETGTSVVNHERLTGIKLLLLLTHQES